MKRIHLYSVHIKSRSPGAFNLDISPIAFKAMHEATDCLKKILSFVRMTQFKMKLSKELTSKLDYKHNNVALDVRQDGFEIKFFSDIENDEFASPGVVSDFINQLRSIVIQNEDLLINIRKMNPIRTIHFKHVAQHHDAVPVIRDAYDSEKEYPPGDLVLEMSKSRAEILILQDRLHSLFDDSHPLTMQLEGIDMIGQKALHRADISSELSADSIRTKCIVEFVNDRTHEIGIFDLFTTKHVSLKFDPDLDQALRRYALSSQLDRIEILAVFRKPAFKESSAGCKLEALQPWEDSFNISTPQLDLGLNHDAGNNQDSQELP